MTETQIATRLKWLTRYAIVSTITTGVLVTGALSPAPVPRFGEIWAERINIIEPDGRLAVVLANEARRPGVIVNGTEHTDRKGTSGLLFYNSEGDEAGGISLTSERDSLGRFWRASHQLAFDRFESDQVVAVRYQEDDHGMTAGLHVADFPRHVLPKYFSAIDSIEQLPEPRRAAALREYRIRASELGFREIPRLFVGTVNRAAVLEIRDTAGQPRIRLEVDSLGTPLLEFLGDSGEVIHRVSGRGPS